MGTVPLTVTNANVTDALVTENDWESVQVSGAKFMRETFRESKPG